MNYIASFWRRSFWLFRLIGVVLLFLILISSFFFTFSVKSVVVQGTSKIIGLQSLYGKPIFLIDSDVMEKKLYELNPRIKSVNIIKKYPSQILISVIENKEMALLAGSSGYLLLDSEGRIITKSKEVKKLLPLIVEGERRSITVYKPGEKITSRTILYSLHFIELLGGLGFPVERVDIQGLDVIICKLEDRVIYLTINRSKEEQGEILRSILRHFVIERIDFESLDVRFDKPVVKLRKTTENNYGQ